MHGRLIVVCTALLAASAAAQSAPLRLSSPSNHLQLEFALRQGVLSYSVAVDGKAEELSSTLGLGPAWDHGFSIVGSSREQHRSEWRPLYGERNLIPDRYNQLEVTLAQQGQTILRLQMRAYDEGIAFRYVAESAMQISSEATDFRWPQGTMAYQEHGGTEGEYSRTPIGAIAPQCQAPLTLVLPDGTYASILEAASDDFPLMTVGTKPGTNDTVEAELGGPATLAAGAATPWRAVMFAATPGELLEHNYLQLDLNAPQAIHDVAWIHPGTAIRETSLTTAGARKLIDFAAAHGIPYIGFDDHWYGAEDPAHGDATHERTQDDKGHPTAPLSIEDVAAYGKVHGIGLILYVDRRQAYKQRDIIFPLYEKWGVAGVKIGFVDVGTQQDTAWITETVRKAAEHHLVLDIHDQYRNTGYTRTYPNLLTVEGVRGNEHFPTAEHNATLPFTRFLAGSADATICYMDPRLKNTHGHQMAMSVIVYSPLQWIFWYDTPASFHDEPELPWFDHLPTVWDDTRVPLGEIGKYAVVARRSGERWYVGALTNGEARTLPLKLTFLRPGESYNLTIYRDDPSVQTATHIAIDHRRVTRETMVQLSMPASGGETLLITPAAK